MFPRRLLLGFWLLASAAAAPHGCVGSVAVTSNPFTLATVIRLPRIETFWVTDEKSGDGFAGSLKGFDLETIEKTGWDSKTGLSVADLPRPVAGEGAKQAMRIAMPWPSPSPKAPVFVFLRGEAEGRATKVTQ